MGIESVCPSSRTGLGTLLRAFAIFSSIAPLLGSITSEPGGKKADSRRLTTRPLGCKLISNFPVFNSFCKSTVRAFRDGTSSSTTCSGASFAAFRAPPGPFICALPCPRSSTVPPRTLAIAAAVPFMPPLCNACCTESDTCLAFALSVCEEANITTKNANSSVMKSAYETSHLSWFSTACFLLPAMIRSALCGNSSRSRRDLAGVLPGFLARAPLFVRLQLHADQFRVHALHDADDSLQHHLLCLESLMSAGFQFIGRWK